MLTKNHPATLQGTCQIFRTGAIHQSEAYHSYTPVPGPSVYTQHSTAGSVSGTRVSWPCPAPVIRHETLWHPRIFLPLTWFSFHLLLWHKKGILCPCWPDTAGPFIKKESFVSGHH
jgi:hypothetical protein